MVYNFTNQYEISSTAMTGESRWIIGFKASREGESRYEGIL
jgi:hypothetical protein